MHKLLTGLSVAAAALAFASAGQACDFHAKQVTASVPSEEIVAMSTIDTKKPAVLKDDSAVVTECPAGEECAPAGDK